ncbi:MAG: acyl-CoA dehydrogenase [Desulfobacteraceae bacterium]|nr:acyl-CoA dehydrogenase [Desulfobacteraceae bacterium]MBC2758115.1 acyl-CoA dehydrogenase [Desulfobacteraceae bacterium]
MATKFVSEKNLKFLLYDVFNIESLTQYPYFKQHNRKMFDMVLDAALKIGQDLLRPILEDMDKIPPVLSDGVVKVHKDVRKIMKECGEGGWIAATFPEENGGEQLPITISNCCYFIMAAANYSAYAYPLLTTGAANLIISFGNKDQIKTYLPNMIKGKWQGTMALTEPQAGSSLSDIATSAEPTEEGYYKIKGQKIFISAGDHDGVKNVVHLMLARIDGAPAGVKGISLFVVPKKRPDKKGKLVSNDVTVSQIYHKLGYKGTPIIELSMGEKDDCRGYLIGEPHKGLFYMFQMMNEARVGVGLGAAAVASAAYYASLDYSLSRPQGRKISEKDPSRPQIPIIEHADVKRMLLFQRAVVDGSLSLLLQCSLYADLEKLSDGEEKEKYALLLDILTPIAKSYPSEMGIHSVSQGLQCLGGYGYCEDFPLEQYYRDIRINPIHEGTTGIQGIDLLGRKVMMKNGQAFILFLEEVKKTITGAAAIPELKRYARELFDVLEILVEVTDSLKGVAITKRPEVFLADATLYLELFSIMTIAWQWLLQAIHVQKALEGELSQKETNFYQGKRYVFQYFFAYELSKIEGLARRLKDSNPFTVDMKKEYFSD